MSSEKLCSIAKEVAEAALSDEIKFAEKYSEELKKGSYYGGVQPAAALGRIMKTLEQLVKIDSICNG